MADLKTEQGINAELEKQQVAYDKLDGRSRAALKIKANILKLEEKLAKISNEISATEKSINVEIDKRIKKVRELSTQDSAAAKLKTAALKAQNQTLNLIRGQVSAGVQLKGILKEQKDTVLALGTGMNDIAGIQNLQAQSAVRMNKLKEKEQQASDWMVRAASRGNYHAANKLSLKSKELSKQQDIEESLQENLKV